jgi:hypothetical protein
LPAEIIARTAKEFRRCTPAVDGLHPREIVVLTEPLLECLAVAFRTFEAFGFVGSAQEERVIRLIRKTVRAWQQA